MKCEHCQGTGQVEDPFRPKPLENMDFSKLIQLCQGYLDKVEQDQDNDYDRRLIFEAAMEAVFGQHVWDWIDG